MAKETIGDRLRQAREKRGLKSRELSEKAGLSPATASAIETGVRPNVTIDTVEVFARALDVPPEWLAWGRGPSGL